MSWALQAGRDFDKANEWCTKYIATSSVKDLIQALEPSSGEPPSIYLRWPLEGGGAPILTPPACPSVVSDHLPVEKRFSTAGWSGSQD